ESADHLDTAGPPLSKLDLRLYGATVHHAIDKPLLAARKNGRFRDEHRVLAPIDDDLHAREQAGKQCTVTVRKAGAQADRTAVRIHDGVDGIYLALERAPGYRVYRDPDRLPG